MKKGINEHLGRRHALYHTGLEIEGGVTQDEFKSWTSSGNFDRPAPYCRYEDEFAREGSEFCASIDKTGLWYPKMQRFMTNIGMPAMEHMGVIERSWENESFRWQNYDGLIREYSVLEKGVWYIKKTPFYTRETLCMPKESDEFTFIQDSRNFNASNSQEISEDFKRFKKGDRLLSPIKISGDMVLLDIGRKRRDTAYSWSIPKRINAGFGANSENIMHHYLVKAGFDEWEFTYTPEDGVDPGVVTSVPGRIVGHPVFKLILCKDLKRNIVRFSSCCKFPMSLFLVFTTVNQT